MGKIRGNETRENLPEKVLMIYEATMCLLYEGADLNSIKVEEITKRAGIGKGTAYDYFDSKEDIIVYSILFYMNSIIENILEEMGRLNTFEQRICCLFDAMEQRMGDCDCFLKFVHLASSASPINRSLSEAIERLGTKIHTPLSLFYQMIDGAIEGGEITDTFPKEYIMYSISSKIICYAIFLEDERKNKKKESGQETIDRNKMRELICRGILQEFKD